MLLRIVLACIFAIFASTSLANQKIDFSNEETAKEILLGKTWTCQMIDTHGEGPGMWTFSSVQGNKVKGNIVIPQYKTCNSDMLKGKLKKDVLTYHANSMAQCVSVDGMLKFFRDDNGLVKAKGTYVYGGQRVVGIYTCE